MKYLISLLAVLSLSASASQCQSSDIQWTSYGQYVMAANTGYDNPTGNITPILGSSSLPYTVPAGYKLVIDAWGVEGYDTTGVVVITGFLGSVAGLTPTQASAYRIANGFHSTAALKASNADSGFSYHIPAGQIVNIRLINGSAYAGTYGWYVSGCLIPQ